VSNSKPLFLTILFFTLLVCTIALYQFFSNREATTVWHLIPDNTVLVYEFGDCEQCYVETTDHVAVGLIKKIILPVNEGDSLFRQLKFLSTPRGGSLLSVHVTSKNSFDVIQYFSKSGFNNFLTQLKTTPAVDFSQRVLNGFTIEEFRFGAHILSLVELDGIVVVSFTPFLLEDVVRKFVSKEESGFVDRIAGVYALPRISNDLGNVYIHLENLVAWLGVFEERGTRSIVDLGVSSLLDVKASPSSITLNGFTKSDIRNTSSLLSIFEGQSPIEFGLKHYVSSGAAYLTDYGISDIDLLYKSILGNRRVDYDSLQKITGFTINELFSSIKNELAVCYIEEKDSFAKVILLNTSNPENWISFLNTLSDKTETEDTVFFEQFSNYQIREITLKDLPGKLFSPLVRDFSKSYYTRVNDVIMISENLEVLKASLRDIDNDDVWGKSVSLNKFLESTLLESNVSVYVNTPLVLGNLLKRLDPKWKDFLTKNNNLIKALKLGSIQFSYLNDSYYTNVYWEFGKAVEGKKPILSDKINKVVASLPFSVIGKPHIVRSHISKNDEVIVQDSLYTIYHISDEGKVLWSEQVDGPIIGSINQVDFFNNGKLQFFFATRKKLHVIDRLGKYVSPFPSSNLVGDIEYVSLVDYDGSKKYRFLVADKTGKLWMFDKSLAVLDGWKPLIIENELFSAMNHHRIRGKDYIIAIRKDGWVYLMNRRGEYLKGFPLNIDSRPDGDYFLEMGTSNSDTYFVCVSRDGFRIKFGLDGKVVNRDALVKPSVNTQFSLVPEKTGKSYLIKRQSEKSLSLLTDDGKELVTNNYIGSNSAAVRYYDFGSGRKFIAVTDIIQEISFIYDGSGTLLTPNPIPSSSIELKPGIGDMPKIFSVIDNTLTIQ
jgi:hypothetical protein